MGTLGNLPVGAKVKIHHSVIGDIPCIIADQNHGGYPENSTTLITEKIILLRAFDAKEPNNSDDNRIIYGNNKYSVSNLDQWLNSTAAAGQWYSARHSADKAPNNANVVGNCNEYDKDAGFLAGFDDAFVASLKDTTLKVALNTVTDGGSYESVVRKFFLPSRAELFGVAENGVMEGSLLSYFSANTNDIRKARVSAYAAAHSKYSVTAGERWYYWLRTPRSSNSYSVRSVFSEGTLNDNCAALGSYGVRPLCNLDSGISVSDTTDSDGCYALSFAPTIYFRHLYSGGTIGSGAVKFKEYTQTYLPQLATPTNVSASGTTISWDEVANAESYDVYVDNTLYENTTGTVTPKGFTVSYTNNGNSAAPAEFKINGGNYTTITAASGTFENVETIQFYLNKNEFYACTIKSTTLGINLSANSVSLSDTYTLTQDVTDIVISWQPTKNL